MILAVDDPGSSNGRTPGFGPGNRGSNPCPGTKKNTLVKLGCFSDFVFLKRRSAHLV